MNTLFMLLCLASMVAVPVCLVLWLVKLVTKKPAKKMLKRALVSAGCCVVFFVLFGLTMEKCEHEYTLVESETATCEQDGYEKYHCDLCDRDKTEKLKKLGHDMVNGVCSRCGHEETEKQDEAAEKQKLTDVDIVVDGETIYGFYDVIDAVGIDRNDAKYVKKTDDWRLGPCYKFSTEGTTARVNCNMDGTVNHLEVGNGIMLYQQGYEPWNIADFIVSEDVKLTITMMTEDAVKQCLNYPATADFPIFDWSYGRRFNQYTARSTVTAKNGFGVESEMPFTAGFWVEDDTAKLIYLEVDGAVVKNELEQYPIPEREEIPFEVEQPENGSIRIYDGQLGEYGKKVQLDSYEYDWYMVPAGKYEAVSNVKTCTVYVKKNEITRNSDGYSETEIVATYTWGYGETIIIEVGEDEHLFNVYGADYTLTPIN